MSRDALIEALRTALAAEPGVALALLFGSRARGDDRPGSDADVAVLAADVDLIALADRLERIAHVAVDVTDARAAPYPLLQSILRDGVRIFERTPGAHARFVSTSLADLETDLPNLRLMQRALVDRIASVGILSRGR